MNYVDKAALQESMLSEKNTSPRELMDSVDKSRVEQDILNAVGHAFKPFLYTYDPMEGGSKQQMTADDQDLLDQLYEPIQSSKMEARRALKKLQKLKRKYPKVPVIYNFISVVYQTLKQDKKHYYTIKMTCKKFPDYIFAKASLANYQLSHGIHEGIPEIFNDKLQLYMHYPDAGELPTFHASEVQAFYTVIGRYYARTKQIACAIKCYFLVEKAGKNSPHLDVLAQEIMTAELAMLVMDSLKGMTEDL